MEETSKLIQTLRDLLGNHRSLLDLVKRELKALEAADLKSIHECTCEKEVLLSLIQDRERKRQELVAIMAHIYKIPASDLSLDRIIEQVQGRDLGQADTLRNLKNTLKIVVDRVRAQNSRNQALVESSLKHVGQMKMNVLGERASGADSYMRNGKRRSSQPGVSRLLVEEV